MPDVDALPLQSFRYQYDHDGVRVGREKWEYDAGTEEWTRVKIKRFLVDKLQPFAQVVAEYIDNAAEPTDIATDDILRLRYAHGDDLLTQTRIVQTTATTRYLHADGQLSTRQLTDTNADPAAVIEAGRYTYDAFGEDLSLAGESFDAGSGSTTAYRYTGEHYDNESGHYHLRARQYDPAVGRFNGRDPLLGNRMRPATLNKYVYVVNNPVLFVDPSGAEGVIAQLQMASIRAQLFVINVGLRIGPVFAAGGATLGRFWQQVGRITEQFFRTVVSARGDIIIQRAPPFGNRVLDFLLRRGDQIAAAEVKYGLPSKAGSALTRLVAQM